MARSVLFQFWWEAARIGIHARMTLSTRVLHKTLGLSNAARARLSRGTLMNNMAIDAPRLDDTYVLPFSHWMTVRHISTAPP